MYILGHRGEILPTNQGSHENSLGSIRKGVEFADGIECDVCKTQDGSLIVIHEARCAYDDVEYCLAENLDEASAERVGERTLNEISAAEAKELFLKNGEPVPFLEDVLDVFSHQPNKILNIELKGIDVALDVLKATHRCIESGLMTVDQFLISSFDHDAVYQVKQADHLGIKLGLLFLREDQPIQTTMHPWVGRETSSAVYPNFSIENLSSKKAQRVDPDVIIIPEPTLVGDNVHLIHEYFPRAKVATWIFSEIQNDQSSHIESKIVDLKGDGILEAVIIDDPKKTTEKLRALGA